MVEGWTCERCSTSNVEPSLVCSNCGATRPADDVAPALPADQGGVGWAAPQAAPPADQGPSGWVQPGGTPAAPSAAQGPTGWVSPDAPGPSPWVPSDGTDVPPPAPKPLWRRIPIGALIFVVLIAAGAIGGVLFNAGRSSTGEINKAGDLTAADIRLGDCFDLKDATATDKIEKVTARPCADPHEYEMIFVGSLPAGSYPAEKAFEDYVAANCLPAFNAYIGNDYDSSDLDMYWLYPTDDAWRGGDRSVQCAAYDPGNAALRGSLKGSRR